ncbi:MAG: hypothetical protein QXL16_01105, partial [Candidatus Micrarchaeaceae archaeon]
KGNILRFANKVPLLFDSGSCAITEAVKSVNWRNYGIDFENSPITVIINVSSVFVPYSGVGKQAVAQEEEIVEEVRLATMELARSLEKYIKKVKVKEIMEKRAKLLTKYAYQLASDLSEITGRSKEEIEKRLIEEIEKRQAKEKTISTH